MVEKSLSGEDRDPLLHFLANGKGRMIFEDAV